MKKRKKNRALWFLPAIIILMMITGFGCRNDSVNIGYDLETGFISPPDSAKPGVFWWWLNSLVDSQAITRDLEEFRANGIGRILIVDAGGARGDVPAGSVFMGDDWRALFKFALTEAHRLNLEVSVNLVSGWCMGGPWVTPEYGMKSFASSDVAVTGPMRFSDVLPKPKGVQYNDIALQAFRENSPVSDTAGIIDLTGKMKPDGTLDWEVPEGRWIILRSGYISSMVKTAFSSPNAGGLHIDGWSKSALDFHYQKMASVLIEDAGKLVGNTLKYLHSDSWENGNPTWSDNIIEDYKKYRGYSMIPYLRVLADDSASDEVSKRFHFDLLKTYADAMANNYYGRFAELAHEDGLLIHNEAGGPSWPMNAPMDALKNLGKSDMPMGEFWMPYDAYVENELGYMQNWVGKQTGSAAHIYGKRWAAAEAFTNLIGHWIEDPRSMKQAADIAFCEGMNRFLIHESTCIREEDGIPGYEYFAGTHFNPNLTWWRHVKPFLTWMARCQYLLAQGLFVGDVCYYLGDSIPGPNQNPVRIKLVYPTLGLGYDYDICNSDVIMHRMTVSDGKIMLPDGMSYRILVLPNKDAMTPELLRKIESLVHDGATVVGPKPVRAPGLKNYPENDKEVQELANKLWGDCNNDDIIENVYGKGRIYWGKDERDILTDDGINPDFEFKGQQGCYIDYIHRSTGNEEIYYVANRNDRWEKDVRCNFRVRDMKPEIWDPVSGSVRPASVYSKHGDRIELSLEFAPFGSMFIVFREKGAGADAPGNFPLFTSLQELGGPWTVKFDPEWGGPESVIFDSLLSWTEFKDDQIRYYSGTATYMKQIELDDQVIKHGKRVFLNLGDLKNVCEVRLNGKALGTLWTEPFRIEITDAIKESGNVLEIDVTNLWANRLVGDWKLPEDERYTHTNVWHLYRDPKVEGEPLVSGLLGPVSLQLLTYEPVGY